MTARELTPHERGDLGAEQFDAMQQAGVSQPDIRHLHGHPLDTAEVRGDAQDLLRHGLGGTDEESAVGTALRVVLPPAGRAEPALPPDLGEHLLPARVEVITGLLVGVAHEAEAVQADFELLSRVTSLAPGLTVEVNERTEAAGWPPMMATMSGRPRTPARTKDSGVPPTPTQIGSGSWSGRG